MATSLTFGSATAYNTSSPKFGSSALLMSGVYEEVARGGKIPASGSFTVEAWVKTTGTSLIVAVSQVDAFYFGINASGQAICSVGLGGSETSLNTTVVINNGAWHHLALVYTTSGLTFFVDGISAATSGTAPTIDRTTNPIALGGFATLGAYMWIGSIDEVATWASAKYTANFTVPSAPYTGSEANLIDLYHLDEAAGTGPALPSDAITLGRNTSGIFWAPYVWDDDGAAKIANSNGSYVKFRFTGTVLGINITPLTGLTLYPTFRAFIDNLPPVDVTPTAGQDTIVFANDLASATHSVRIFLKATPTAGRWDCTSALKITGFALSAGSAISAPSIRTKRMIFYGDSITAGERVYSQAESPAGADGTRSVVPYIAEALDAEYGQIGYGAVGFLSSGDGGVPAFNTAYGLFNSAGRSRLSAGVLPTAPDYVMVMHGRNGSAAQADAAAAITNMRTIAPAATIFMIVSPTGYGRPGVTAAVAAAKSAGDAKLFLIDLGSGDYQAGLDGSDFVTPSAQASDSCHPYDFTNARLASGMMKQIDAALQPRRFTVTAA